MAKHGTAPSLSSGQFAEFAAAVVRQLPRDFEPGVAQGWIENQGALTEVLRKALVPSDKAVVLFQRDMTKEGWTLLENVPFNDKSFTPDIVEFLKPGEFYVDGEVMRSRAKELNANLGQTHAEYLLEHQDLIPKEWRGKYYLVFPGTIWRGRRGDRGVPCLDWGGGRWYLRFSWLGGGWDSDGRLVSLRK